MGHDNILKYYDSSEIKEVEFANHILLNTGSDYRRLSTFIGQNMELTGWDTGSLLSNETYADT